MCVCVCVCNSNDSNLNPHYVSMHACRWTQAMSGPDYRPRVGEKRGGGIHESVYLARGMLGWPALILARGDLACGDWDRADLDRCRHRRRSGKSGLSHPFSICTPSSCRTLVRSRKPLSTGLVRELVRQAVLIAAHDEMGLSTRDESLRRTICRMPRSPHHADGTG